MNLSRRILLVDDDELLRDLLEMTLALEGYQVGVASNGAEALALLENTEFDLIILDLMMPILDGMRFLKRLPGGKQPPIIVLSASSNAAVTAQVEKLGAAAVARKPVDPEEFLKLVHSTLSSGSVARP